jgi:hypothetical protein
MTETADEKFNLKKYIARCPWQHCAGKREKARIVLCNEEPSTSSAKGPVRIDFRFLSLHATALQLSHLNTTLLLPLKVNRRFSKFHE